MTYPQLSICTSARNRADLLARTLGSIAFRYSERIAAGEVEVLVVDDSSTDHTPGVLGGCPWVRGARMDRPGGYLEDPARVFNHMLGLARGDVLLQQSAEVVHVSPVGRQLLEAVEPGVVAFATVLNGDASLLPAVEQAVAEGWTADSGEWTGLHDRRAIDPHAFRPDGGAGTATPPVRIQCGGHWFEVYTGIARPVPFFFCGAITRADWMRTGGYPVDVPHGASDLHLAIEMMRLGYTFRFLGGAVAFHVTHGKT